MSLAASALCFFILTGFWAVLYLLSRDTLGHLDLPPGQLFSPQDVESKEVSKRAVTAINKRLRASAGKHEKLPWKERVLVLRETMDSFFAGTEIVSTLIAVDAGGVPAEWVKAPGVDCSRRLLYIHGGAFFAGSPKKTKN